MDLGTKITLGCCCAGAAVVTWLLSRERRRRRAADKPAPANQGDHYVPGPGPHPPSREGVVSVSRADWQTALGYAKGAVIVVLLVCVAKWTGLLDRWLGEAPARLRASVEYNGFSFVIANNDDFPWRHVTMKLNAGDAFTDYTHSVSRIDAKGSYRVPARDFRHNGGRFDPRGRGPRRLTISAMTPKGRGVWRCRWP